MLTKAQKACPLADDIVSYMYDELPAADRTRFEDHLLECQECTDEFAGISVSRFEVFDWRREEFDHLETPAIVIPYRQPAVSIAGRLSEWFGLGTAIPVAAAAILAILAGYLIYTKTSQVVTAPEVAVEAPQTPVSAMPVPAVNPAPAATIAASDNLAPGRQRQPVVRQASLTRKALVPSSVVARKSDPAVKLGNDVAVNVGVPKKQEPRLTAYDEDDDTSLRLADLFDDDGPPPLE